MPRAQPIDPYICFYSLEAFERVYDEILKIYSATDGRTTIIPGITKELHRHNF